MIKLIAALGNPGPEYQASRHNAAWQLVEYFSFFEDLKWQKKFNGEFTEVNLSGEKVFIILPLTFMNRSGSSISTIAKFYKIEPDEILVIHDELELDFGIVGFKQGGGLGGHNGLRSTTSSLGTRDFNRFRIGISRPEHKDVTSYVLGNFNREEQKELPFLLESGADILEENIGIDFDQLDMKHRKIRIL
ncbi:MAG: aminoacyl-tRNA hydrolase [Acidobacteriota bacterium]